MFIEESVVEMFLIVMKGYWVFLVKLDVFVELGVFIEI